MEMKGRVGRRSEKVEKIGPGREMTAAVDTEVEGPRRAGHDVLEVGDVGGLEDEVVDAGLIGVPFGDVGIEIACEAVRVVVQRAGGEDATVGEDLGEGEVAPWNDGIGKGAVRDAATAGAARERGVGADDGGPLGRIVGPVAAETVGAAIKERTSFEVRGPEGPIPVRERALVAAFVDEGLLQEVDEVAMPT